MEQKKTQSRFGSNLFLSKKSESEKKSEDKSESSCNNRPDWVFRLAVIENQNKEIIRRYEDMRRQNDKIIQQNEIILEMFETQMKLLLDDKNHQGGPRSSNIVRSSCNSSQSLAVSNPLYKFNPTTPTTTTGMEAKSDGARQKVTVKKSQALQMERSQPTQKISRAVAVWQVMKPSSEKESCLQGQLLGQLSNLLMEKGLRLEEGTRGPCLLTRLNSSSVEGVPNQRMIIASLVPFRNVPPRFFSQTEEVASSSIPGCDLLVELFVDTSGTLLFDCAHNTEELKRVILFLFR